MTPTNITTTVEQLQQQYAKAIPSSTPQNIFHRPYEKMFVNPYKNSHLYWEKCYPLLYPYGRGGPSDMLTVLSIDQHTTLNMKSAGGKFGRRGQQNPGYIFHSYTYQIRRSISYVTLLAQKVHESARIYNNSTTPNNDLEVAKVRKDTPISDPEVIPSTNIDKNEVITAEDIA